MGTSDDSSFLVALPSEHGSASPTAASKLEVGPSAISKFDFLRNAAFGPYWIVAVGAENVAVPGDEEESGDADEPGDGPAPEAEASQQLVYRWAVVAGGEPDSVSGGACTTFESWLPTTLQYRGGLWIFTRDPLDAAAAAEARAAAAGVKRFGSKAALESSHTLLTLSSLHWLFQTQ
mmetsp:Transcript_19492/g.57775  ORF Transcript_19492/g.57775 Transcript_19492/m.57775 type:complete len:177 (-) Transcript_19492:310-840(-)